MLRDFLDQLLWMFARSGDAFRALVGRAYCGLKNIFRRILGLPVGGSAGPLTTPVATRFAQRRAVELGFAERQALAAERQMQIVANFVEREADRHAARMLVTLLAVVVLVLCAIFIAVLHSQAPMPAPMPVPMPVPPGPGIPPTPYVPVDGVSMAVLGWIALVATIVFFFSIAFIIATRSPTTRAVATAFAVAAPTVVTGVSAWSLFKGGSFIKIENFKLSDTIENLKLPDFVVKPPQSNPPKPEPPEKKPSEGGGNPVELSVVVNVTSDKTQLPPVEFLCDLNNRPLRVGTFVSGESGVLEAENRQTVADLAEAIGTIKLGKKLVGVMLIGSADKTHLKPETVRQYDSNLGLAQARALYVQGQLLELKKAGDRRIDDLSTILALNAGPTQLGPDKIDTRQLAEDRSVRACVIVQPRP